MDCEDELQNVSLSPHPYPFVMSDCASVPPYQKAFSNWDRLRTWKYGRLDDFVTVWPAALVV